MEFHPTIFFLQLITFTLGLVLAYFVYMPYLKGWMTERRDRIAGQLEAAARAQKAAEDLKAEVDRRSREMDAQARNALAEARAEADRSKAEIVGTARREAEKLVADAREAMSQEREAVVREVRKEVGALSVAIAERILRSSVDAKAQQKLIDESLKELTAKKN
jgi:F-type H+-transporting ATPase subunit b